MAYCGKCGEVMTGEKNRTACGSPIESNRASPTTSANFDEKPMTSNQLAMWTQLSPLMVGVGALVFAGAGIGLVLAFLGWLPPMLIKRRNLNDSFIVQHANESMNFQLFWIIMFIPLLIASVITLGLAAIAVFVFGTVVEIQATIAASRGESYRYPCLFFRLIK